jgi:hypothetical protein
MESPTLSGPNVKQIVPLLMVESMEVSLRYYVDGLRFERKNQWIVDGQIRWCWLELGGAALMLQEYRGDGPNAKKLEDKVGVGMSLWFTCQDSIVLYDEFRARGIACDEPFVGNGLWDLRLKDPDGYWLHFESPTEVPEDTKLSEVRPARSY